MKTFQQFISEAYNAYQNFVEDSGQEFYNRIYRQAKAAGDRFPHLTAAQGYLESGGGKSPSGKNNYFGQKASTGTVASTREVGPGGSYRTNATFQDFDSEEEGTRNRVNRWSYKYGDAKNELEAARNLQLPPGAKIPGSDRISHGVYATDPNYVDALDSIMRERRGGVEDDGPSSGSKPPGKSPAPQKPVTRKVIADKGGKGGTVSTNTAYQSKLGGIKATATRGDTGTQVIRAKLAAQKPSNPIAALFKPKEGSTEKAKLGGLEGTIKHGPGGARTFTAIKPAAKPK